MEKIVISLKDKEFNSFEEFGQNIYLYPDESLKLILSDNFLNLLKECDQNKYEQILSLLKESIQDDCLLFKAQYIFNPLMSLRYHGYNFNNYQELGALILKFAPKIDIYLKDFLKYNLLSFYMHLTNFDKRDEITYQKILKLEMEFLENENRAYFKLGFILSKQRNIVFAKHSYEDINALLDIALKENNIYDFASDCLNNQYLISYLDILGYEKEILEFENIVSNIEEKEKIYDSIRKV